MGGVRKSVSEKGEASQDEHKNREIDHSNPEQDFQEAHFSYPFLFLLSIKYH